MMWGAKIVPLAWACLVRLVAQQAEASPQERLEVHVTAASGASLYLDKGSADRAEPGDRVVLFPLGGGVVETTLQSVSRTSSRCLLPPGTPAVDLGTRGELYIPRERGKPTLPAERRPDLPEHPPWTQAPQGWDESLPLLATALRRPPGERDVLLRGRVYSQYLQSRNREEVDNSYSLFRSGADVHLENLYGGVLRAQGEVYRKTADLEEGEDSEIDRGRLDRFSYTIGGREKDPWRLELGRFFQNAFPELGLLDGGEARLRTPHHRFGASAGLLPAPLAGLSVSDDLQAAASYEIAFDEKESFVAGIAYQRTWHEGDPDRDLLLAKAFATPVETVSLYASVWLDYYGPHDAAKSDGFEVTEAHAQGTWRFADGQGLALRAMKIRTPNLLRDEIDIALQPLVLDTHVERYGVSTWHALSRKLRADTRLDQWTDQSGDEGITGELRLSLRDVLWEQGDVSAAVYRIDGVFSSGEGLRFSATRTFTFLSVSATYDVGRYTFTSSGENTLEQTLHAAVDVALDSGWSLSVYADVGFGDERDFTSAGIFVQKRF